jgi:biotin carboxylase
MNGANGALLAIGSGLKLYREYLVRSAAARARSAGLELVLINNLRPSWQLEYFADVIVANAFDEVQLAKAAREMAARHKIVGVICWDEPLVHSTAELAAELGVPGLTLDGVLGCRDKYRTRSVLSAAGIRQPDFDLAGGVEHARAVAARIGYPVVLKPRALGASIGVVLAVDERELDRAFQVAWDASQAGKNPRFRGAIIEGYAPGPEISVDGAVHDGGYQPMFVARKESGFEPFFEEIGHVVDAADPLLADRSLMSMLAEAHRALGVKDGITHTEVRLTDQGPVIIEVNGRLGGDLIPFIGKLATGIDPGVVLVDVASGRRPHVAASKRGVAGIRFGYPAQDCVVRAISLPSEGPGLVQASAMVGPGTELRLPPGGYIARHSFVICEADDPAGCAERLAAAAARVRVDAEPIPPPAPGTPYKMPAGLLDVDEQ